MKADELLRFYERVADAPDAVARLRRFVLDLAVRGKLVAQVSSEEPATELIRQLAVAKARLLSVGALTKERQASSLEDNPPFELPDRWRWLPFGELHQLIRGVTYSKSDVSEVQAVGFVPVLRANNIGVCLTHDEPVFVSQDRVSAEQFLRRGDFMIALSSGSKNLVGKCALVPENYDEAFGGFCGVVRLHDERIRNFAAVYLRSDLYRESIAAGSRGIGINNLKKGTVSNLYFPLPPLAEQHRIVAKVDELMALCDRLEAARATREAARDRLAAASLARLNAPDPETFHEDARFALHVLPALSARSEQVRALRDTVCRMALRGQFSSEESWPAGPSQLCDFVRLQSGYAFKSEWFGSTGVRLLRNVNVAHGKVNWADEAFLPHDLGDAYERFKLNAGDIVLSLNRPFIGTGTKVAMIRHSDLPALLVQRVARLKVSDGLSHEFLLLWLQSSLFREQVQPVSTNVAPHIAPGDIDRSKIFVPDLDEQGRIVTKVVGLMSLCDRLEASLASTDTHRRRLLEALLHEALQPA